MTAVHGLRVVGLDLSLAGPGAARIERSPDGTWSTATWSWPNKGKRTDTLYDRHQRIGRIAAEIAPILAGVSRRPRRDRGTGARVGGRFGVGPGWLVVAGDGERVELRSAGGSGGAEVAREVGDRQRQRRQGCGERGGGPHVA